MSSSFDTLDPTRAHLLSTSNKLEYGTASPPELVHVSTSTSTPTSTATSTTAVEKDRTWWLGLTSKSYAWSVFALLLTFAIATALEYAVLSEYLPAVDPEHRHAIKLPHTLKDLQELNAVLNIYIGQNYANVLVAFVASYLYLQTFSIPGSMWLSVLAGALFQFWFALALVCLCAALGATNAYLLSYSLGSVFVKRNFGDRIARWNEQLINHRKHMFNYIIVVRILPFPPNWLANIGAPHLDVPIGAFFLGTFFGVAGPSFIQLQAGAALDLLSSSDDELRLFTPLNVLCLAAVAVVALVPVFVRRWMRL